MAVWPDNDMSYRWSRATQFRGIAAKPVHLTPSVATSASQAKHEAKLNFLVPWAAATFL